MCVRTPTLGPDYGYTLVHDVDQRFAADLLEWEGGGGGSTATSSYALCSSQVLRRASRTGSCGTLSRAGITMSIQSK